MYKTIFKAFGLIFLVSLLMLLAFPYIAREIQYITLFSFIGYFFLTLISLRFFVKELSVKAKSGNYFHNDNSIAVIYNF